MENKMQKLENKMQKLENKMQNIENKKQNTENKNKIWRTIDATHGEEQVQPANRPF